MKKYIKKIIPTSLKEKIKKEIDSQPSSNVAYNLNIDNVGRLSNKVAIVTGGSGAIGSAICFRLVAEGATVIVCGRNQERIYKVIKNIENQDVVKHSGKAFPAILDVTDEANITSVIENTISQFGKIDILVNNAGGYADDKFLNIHEKEVSVIDEIMNVNLRGSILCAKEATKKMINKNTNGTIINMASIVGMAGKAGMTDYATSKAGLIGFTKSLAIELSKYNINVNCISPGLINGELFDKGMNEVSTNRNYLGRTGKTDDIASLVAYLSSDEADYITGENIVVDGGRSLGLMGE